MRILTQDGSELTWQIEGSGASGFDAQFRLIRRVSGVPFTEGDKRHFYSREPAVGWLRTEIAIRGFDVREIR